MKFLQVFVIFGSMAVIFSAFPSSILNKQIFNECEVDADCGDEALCCLDIEDNTTFCREDDEPCDFFRTKNKVGKFIFEILPNSRV